MQPQDYLNHELHNCANYKLTADDTARIEHEGIEAYMYAKLTSKKFRKWAVDESSELQAKRAIQMTVAAGMPLQFRFPFGGYKLWRMPSSPEVDWAEFFSIAYYAKYLAPIAAAYKPGLEFQFASDDVIIERMDNVPVADTSAYFNSFQQLLEAFRPHFPANFNMSIVRIGDLYENKDELEKELATNVKRFTVEYATTVPETKKQKMYTTSELNIQWDGATNLTSLSPEEKRQKIEQGPIYHDAYCALSKRREFNRGDDKIVIFTTVIPNAIAIGTTKASVTKFWTGYGVLEATQSGFSDRIISPSQLAQREGQPCTTVPINLLNMRNFTDIRIYRSH
jgi:hypothetical protein